MSQIENPVETVIRLLSSKMRVVKDDSSLANVPVTREWVSQEALQNVDGHVTVGLAETVDQKLELSGKLRRRVLTLRAGVWSKDSAMRFKIVEEVLRVVRENRNKPNETLYDYVGVYRASGTHKAYKTLLGSSQKPQPTSTVWTELSDADYPKIAVSDDVRYSTYGVGYSFMLFRFKIPMKKTFLSKVVLTFEGQCGGLAGNGFSIAVWNHAAQQWQYEQIVTTGSEVTVSITLSSNIQDFVDGDGYVWLICEPASSTLQYIVIMLLARSPLKASAI